MARQAQIRVSISGGRLVEGKVRSAMTRGGETVERVERPLGSARGREHRFWILLHGEKRSLEEVLWAVEGVRGAAVSGATLFAPEAPLRNSGGPARG